MSLRRQFPGLALGWAVAFTGLASSAAPPPEVTVSQWADGPDGRVISAESGARMTGRWKTSTAPYTRRPMNVAGVDHPAGSMWCRWAAKVGKTQVPLNALGHMIATAPRSAQVFCPTDQKRKDFIREVLDPTVRATPSLAMKVMGAKSRSGEGSTAAFKRFRGGFLKISNAGSEPELQQSDVGLIVFEEPSSYDRDVGGRGPPVRQARARQIAWGDDAKEIGTGTPKFVGDCVVTAEVMRRTCERYYLACPHCGARQVLKWENMTRSEGRPYFLCQADDCGALIGHEHKRGMLDQADAAELRGETVWLACFAYLDANGKPDLEHPNQPPPDCIKAGEEWDHWVARRGADVGRMLEGRDPSFDGIWQAYSPFTTWAKILEAYDEAQASGDPDDLVTFWQQVLGLPFEPAYDKPDVAALFKVREAAAKIAGVQRGRMPVWAWALMGSADVQGDRIEWAVYAVGPGEEMPDGAKARRYARIDSGIIPVPPVDPRAWSELATITARTYEGPACRPIGFDRFGVDTGGHHTNQAYMFCAGRPNVMALKGSPKKDCLPIEAGTRRKARIGGRVVAEVQLYHAGVHAVKKSVYFGLAQMRDGVEQGRHLPGSITLPADATEQDFDQLVSEVLLPPDRAKGRKEELWEPLPGKRNEQLDLVAYCHALAWSFLPDQMTEADWVALIAKRRRDPTTAAALPLEQLWGEQVQTAAPPRPAVTETARGSEPAAHAMREPEPAAANAAENPLLRLARLNRGDA